MISIRLSRLFKTQRHRLRNLAILLLANVFTAGVGFFTTVTIANTLGSARFGQFAYALAIGGILAVNVRFGMDRSLIRDLVHFPESFDETLTASLLARGFLLTVCVSGLLLLMALPIADLDISWGMFLVILATALSPLQITNVFDVWECQGRHAIYLCLQKAIYFAIIWGIVLWNPQRLGLVWIGSALFMATLVFLCLQYGYAWVRLNPSFEAMRVDDLVRVGLALLVSNKWLWLAALAGLGMTALNKIVLRLASGYTDLGAFAASLQLAAIATLLLKSIARIGRPILARHTGPDRQPVRRTKQFLGLYLCLGVFSVSIVSIPAILVPQELLKTFFIPEYANAYWVLRILGIMLVFRVFDLFLGHYLTLVRMDRAYLVGAVISGLISLVFSLLLVPLYFGAGAAMAILIAEIFKAGLFLIVTILHMQNSAKDGNLDQASRGSSAAAHALR